MLKTTPNLLSGFHSSIRANAPMDVRIKDVLYDAEEAHRMKKELEYLLAVLKNDLKIGGEEKKRFVETVIIDLMPIIYPEQYE